MAKALLYNHSLSLLMVIMLLAAVVACVRQLDCFVADKLDAFISIFFGLATSSLLLSLMWIVRQKTLNRPWPTQRSYQNNGTSMNPRGREGSLDSLDNAITINTVSSTELDRPPNYADALAYSKPVNHFNRIDAKSVDQQILSGCKCLTTRNVDSNNLLKICPTCLKQLPSSSVSQFASIVVRGFCPLDQECSMHQTRSNENAVLGEKYIENHMTRRTSYVEIDADQLLTSNAASLPRYNELYFGELSDRNSLSKPQQLHYQT